MTTPDGQDRTGACGKPGCPCHHFPISVSRAAVHFDWPDARDRAESTPEAGGEVGEALAKLRAVSDDTPDLVRRIEQATQLAIAGVTDALVATLVRAHAVGAIRDERGITNPEPDGDVREALVRALNDHRPEWRGHGEAGRVVWVCTCGDYWSVLYEDFLAHLADAVLASGHVVPVGEVSEVGAYGRAVEAGNRASADAAKFAQIAAQRTRERDRLQRWKDEMLPVLDGMQSELDEPPKVIPGLAALAAEVDTTDQRIEARQLSGEHVGREVVLPDGEQVRVCGIEHDPDGDVWVYGPKGEASAPIKPSDVVTLIGGEE